MNSILFFFLASIALNSCLPAHSSHCLAVLLKFIYFRRPFSRHLLSCCLSCLNFRPLMQYLYALVKVFLLFFAVLSLSPSFSLVVDDKHNAENCTSYREKGKTIEVRILRDLLSIISDHIPRFRFVLWV